MDEHGGRHPAALFPVLRLRHLSRKTQATGRVVGSLLREYRLVSLFSEATFLQLAESQSAAGKMQVTFWLGEQVEFRRKHARASAESQASEKVNQVKSVFNGEKDEQKRYPHPFPDDGERSAAVLKARLFASLLAPTRAEVAETWRGHIDLAKAAPSAGEREDSNTLLEAAGALLHMAKGQ